jgi:Virulence factor BrkB
VAPWHIPWAGWKDILWRVYASVNDNRLLAVAAGVVFYSLLAIFPAIAAFVSLYGLIADASTIDSHLSLAAGIFPAGAVDILHEQIARLTAKSDAKCDSCRSCCAVASYRLTLSAASHETRAEADPFFARPQVAEFVHSYLKTPTRNIHWLRPSGLAFPACLRPHSRR